MTKVPELDWGKLLPPTPEISKHTKTPTEKFWRYKKQEVPKPTSNKHNKVKRMRVKPKDRHLFREAYDQRQHLRSIMREL